MIASYGLSGPIYSVYFFCTLLTETRSTPHIVVRDTDEDRATLLPK